MWKSDARHYLPEHCTVLGSEEATRERLEQIDAAEVFFTVGSRRRAAAKPGAGPARTVPVRGRTAIPWVDRLPRCSLIRQVGVGFGTDVATRFEYRQRQLIKVLIERRPRHAKCLFGGGAHAKAAILELGGNAAQAQHFDDLKRTLDLRVFS